MLSGSNMAVSPLRTQISKTVQRNNRLSAYRY